MKKLLTILLALLMVFSLVGCSKKQEEKPAEEQGETVAKNPEDYTGTLTIYSPHDQDPLDAGVKAFEAKYPNVKVEVVADGRKFLAPFLHQLAVSIAGFYYKIVAVVAEIQHGASGKAAETSYVAFFLKDFEITVFVFRHIYLPYYSVSMSRHIIWFLYVM